MSEQHENWTNPRWLVGGVLILAGVLVFIFTLTGFALHNWWALFILIPAGGSLLTAHRIYVTNDRKLTAASRGSLIGGAILLLVTLIFLLELPWDKTWPIFLILVGVGVLIGAFGGRKS
jgi:hypothetical protein